MHKSAVLLHSSSSERLESEGRPVRSVVLAMEVFIISSPRHLFPSNHRVDDLVHGLDTDPVALVDGLDLMFVLTFMSLCEYNLKVNAVVRALMLFKRSCP